MPRYYGELTGKHYDSLEAMRHYEGREAMRRNVPSAEEEKIASMPFEDFAKGIHQLEQTEYQRIAQEQSKIDVSALLQSHPEYEDCDHNSACMRLFLEGRGVKNGIVSYDQLEDAFNSLKAGGFLKLKASEVKKQAEQVVTNRVEEIKRERHFDEAEAYAMPMNQLLERAGGIR